MVQIHHPVNSLFSISHGWLFSYSIILWTEQGTGRYQIMFRKGIASLVWSIQEEYVSREFKGNFIKDFCSPWKIWDLHTEITKWSHQVFHQRNTGKLILNFGRKMVELQSNGINIWGGYKSNVCLFVSNLCFNNLQVVACNLQHVNQKRATPIVHPPKVIVLPKKIYSV